MYYLHIIVLCRQGYKEDVKYKNEQLAHYIDMMIATTYEYVSFNKETTLIHSEAVVAVIVWWLNLQLPMQSVPITTDVVSSNLDQGEVYNIM